MAAALPSWWPHCSAARAAADAQPPPNRPRLQAMSIPVCLSDPDSLAKFDMNQCPGLTSLMTDVFVSRCGRSSWLWKRSRRSSAALPGQPTHVLDASPCPARPPPTPQNNVSNPAVACEMSCIQQFDLLPPTCEAKLRESFEKDASTSDISKLAAAWFSACDQLLVAPAPTPAMAPDVAVVEEAPMASEWRRCLLPAHAHTLRPLHAPSVGAASPAPFPHRSQSPRLPSRCPPLPPAALLRARPPHPCWPSLPPP